MFSLVVESGHEGVAVPSLAVDFRYIALKKRRNRNTNELRPCWQRMVAAITQVGHDGRLSSVLADSERGHPSTGMNDGKNKNKKKCLGFRGAGIRVSSDNHCNYLALRFAGIHLASFFCSLRMRYVEGDDST